MNKHRSKILLIVGVLLCVVVLVFVLQPPEPSYNGKSLSYWLEQRKPTNAVALSEDSKRAFRQMGTNVLPHLVSRLKRKDSKFNVWLDERCKKLPLDLPSLSRASHDHAAAILGLEALGNSASNCIPEISKLLEQGETADAAAEALAAIGMTAIPALTNGLSSVDSQIRWKVAAGMYRLGTNGSLAVPALITSLHDPHSGVRDFAAQSLGSIRGEPQVMLPALVACLTDKNSGVRMSAVRAIGFFEVAAQPYLPEVLGTMKDLDMNVRQDAVRSVHQIEPDSIPSFLVGLTDANRNVREAAAYGLQVYGNGDVRVFEALTNALSDKDPIVRKHISAALEANARAREVKLGFP